MLTLSSGMRSALIKMEAASFSYVDNDLPNYAVSNLGRSQFWHVFVYSFQCVLDEYGRPHPFVDSFGIISSSFRWFVTKYAGINFCARFARHWYCYRHRSFSELEVERSLIIRKGTWGEIHTGPLEIWMNDVPFRHLSNSDGYILRTKG
jgi:hypothetical protein